MVSFNRYQRSVADLRLPEGVDRPLIIGEFHFGALDRGMFHTGLVPTASQQERAAAYREYVHSALRNPLAGRHALVPIRRPGHHRPRRRRELPDRLRRRLRHALRRNDPGLPRGGLRVISLPGGQVTGP